MYLSVFGLASEIRPAKFGEPGEGIPPAMVRVLVNQGCRTHSADLSNKWRNKGYSSYGTSERTLSLRCTISKPISKKKRKGNRSENRSGPIITDPSRSACFRKKKRRLDRTYGGTIEGDCDRSFHFGKGEIDGLPNATQLREREGRKREACERHTISEIGMYRGRRKDLRNRDSQENNATGAQSNSVTPKQRRLQFHYDFFYVYMDRTD